MAVFIIPKASYGCISPDINDDQKLGYRWAILTHLTNHTHQVAVKIVRHTI